MVARVTLFSIFHACSGRVVSRSYIAGYPRGVALKFVAYYCKALMKTLTYEALKHVKFFTV